MAPARVTKAHYTIPESSAGRNSAAKTKSSRRSGPLLEAANDLGSPPKKPNTSPVKPPGKNAMSTTPIKGHSDDVHVSSDTRLRGGTAVNDKRLRTPRRSELVVGTAEDPETVLRKPVATRGRPSKKDTDSTGTSFLLYMLTCGVLEFFGVSTLQQLRRLSSDLDPRPRQTCSL